MKTRFAFFGFCLSILLSCADDDLNVKQFVDDASIQSINGTWKVESYENLQAGTIEYQTQENSWGYDIILTFDDSSTPKVFSGQNTSNSVAGKFDYTAARRLKVLEYMSTYVNQPEWGNQFGAAFSTDEISFMVNSDRLRFLYDGDTKSVTLRRQ